jgi:hypothetical protein
MIRFLWLYLATTLIISTSCGQPDTTLSEDMDIQQLSVTRDLLKNAMLDGNIATIRQIYHDDYALVTRSGTLLSRTERIESLASGKLRYLNVGVDSEVTVKIYENMAVVRGVVGPAETEFDGERRESVGRRFTELWICENGQWQELGRQVTAIAASSN